MLKNFADFGSNFQIKSVSAMLSDSTFVGQVYDILKVEYFESESVQWIVKQILKYFEEKRKVPTLDIFKVLVTRIDDEVTRTEIKQSLKKAVIQTDANDLDFIKDQILDFCKKQEIKIAIMQSVDHLQFGKFDEIREVINKAMNVGLNTDLGLDYTEDIASRYEEETRNPVSTGWEVLDELMSGGLSAGELGIVVAPSGVGKSWVLGALGANALKSGKNVLHVTLELSEAYTGLRYDSIITGMSSEMLKNSMSELETTLDKLKGKLRIKWFPTKSISLSGLIAYINKLKIVNFEPDLIIIDYVDLLKYSNNRDKHEVLAELYEEIRGMSGELMIPVWSASQANRSGLEENVIGADKISASYGKIFTCDFVMSLSRKDADKAAQTGRMHIIKNRMGPDGMTLPMKMDTNRGILKVFEPTTKEGNEQKKQMVVNEGYNKQILKDKYFAMNVKDSSDKKSF